jgi:hypothetical protein
LGTAFFDLLPAPSAVRVRALALFLARFALRLPAALRKSIHKYIEVKH